MANFLRFICTPIMAAGWVWFLTKSAYVTGMDLCREWMLVTFEEENEDE